MSHWRNSFSSDKSVLEPNHTCVIHICDVLDPPLSSLPGAVMGTLYSHRSGEMEVQDQ